MCFQFPKSFLDTVFFLFIKLKKKNIFHCFWARHQKIRRIVISVHSLFDGFWLKKIPPAVLMSSEKYFSANKIFRARKKEGAHMLSS